MVVDEQKRAAGILNDSPIIHASNSDNRGSLVVVVEGCRSLEENGTFQRCESQYDYVPPGFCLRKGSGRGRMLCINFLAVQVHPGGYLHMMKHQVG